MNKALKKKLAEVNKIQNPNSDVVYRYNELEERKYTIDEILKYPIKQENGFFTLPGGDFFDEDGVYNKGVNLGTSEVDTSMNTTQQS